MDISMSDLIYFIPLILIQLALQIWATVNLTRTRVVRFDNKVLWGVIIWVFQALGPVAYFLMGRKSES